MDAEQQPVECEEPASPPPRMNRPPAAFERRTDPAVYLFAGGGTGGHLFPGIALAEAIRRKFPQSRTVFAGSDRTIERQIIEANGVEHRALPTRGWDLCRRRPDQFLLKNWQAFTGCRQLIAELRPRVVIGLGGFASAPVVWAAHRAGVPIILLEQNAIPGRATCWLSRLARVVCTTFAESAAFLPQQTPTLVCGNPVRRAIAELWSEPYVPTAETPHLLVLGGSLGADGLNSAVMELVRSQPALRQWRIIHQTGPRQLEAVRATYQDLGQPAEVSDFFDDMVGLYRRADLVISRAGATTLAELACAGRATILVPFPKAKDNHQQVNADAFAREGAAVVVQQAAAGPRTAEGLWKAMEPLIHSEVARFRMAHAARDLARPDAAERVLSLLEAEQLIAA